MNDETKLVRLTVHLGYTSPYYTIEAWGRGPARHRSARNAVWHLNTLKRQGFDTDAAFKSLVSVVLEEFDSIYATEVVE